MEASDMDLAWDLDWEEIRGSRFIQDGPSSGAAVYDMVKLKVLMRFPRVNTAMEDPWTRIEVTT
jgi:hypothetical protein